MQTNNMISFNYRNVMLLLILSIYGFNIVAGLAEQGFGERTEAHVEIRNDLGHGMDLFVHCKSRDIDVGAHLIHFNKTFSFQFRPNFWGTTLYFCKFWLKNEVHWFDIYNFGRDHKHCSKCLWKINAEGGCQLNFHTNKFDLCYPWNKPRTVEVKTKSRFPVIG